MTDSHANVAVLIVSYNGRAYLEDCLDSVLASESPGITLRVAVADNASTDGTLEFVAERFPQVLRLPLETNVGFAGGSNAGWQILTRDFPEADYLFLLNQDTIVEPDCIQRGIAFLRAHPRTGCIQPKLLLAHDRAVFNTAGNRSHFLGFGFMTGFGDRDDGQYDGADEIDFASGAAMLVRRDVLERIGLFQPEFFMYLEDAEFCWRVRQAGFEVRRFPEGRVYHCYRFDDALKQYFHLEKNRLWMLLVHYKWKTLFLLAPAVLLMECGQIAFALRRGLLRERLRVYGFLLRKSERDRLREARRRTQSLRTIGDRAFMTRFTGTIDFLPIRGPLVRFVANPLLGAYWSVARRLIFW